MHAFCDNGPGKESPCKSAFTLPRSVSFVEKLVPFPWHHSVLLSGTSSGFKVPGTSIHPEFITILVPP